MSLKPNIFPTLKWILICVLIGILSGLAAAFFLIALDWVTKFRNHNFEIIWFLPIAGFSIGLLYFYFGKELSKGNNLLIEEYQNPKKTIPFLLAPLVLFSTLITHLFGGSAGREGTAVQISTAIADQFQKFFKLTNLDRKTLIHLGICAGFSAVFGTPLAAIIFALEVLNASKFHFKTVLFSIITAFVAHFTVQFLKVQHTIYPQILAPQISFSNFGWLILVGIFFGFTAFLFSKSCHFFTYFFSKTISFSPFRPLIGGIILVAIIYFFNVDAFLGLGIPEILKSFSIPSGNFDFLIKILLTSLTLGSGYKGGEVTPLFFVGATLGSALSFYVPLPISLLACLGFVAVFAGATHSPLASTIMGMELFGFQIGLFLAIACYVSYYFSGSKGIYSSQEIGGLKKRFNQYLQQKLAQF